MDSEELWMEVRNTVQEVVTKIIPKEKIHPTECRVLKNSKER